MSRTLDSRFGARRGHLGTWRAAAALPACVAGALVVLVLSGWAGDWTPAIVLGWFGCGLLTLTRHGERVTVRIACRLRRPSASDRAILDGPWSLLLRQSGIPGHSLDLYVQHGTSINAFAAGSRSVAVTSRVLLEHRAGRLDDQMLVGLLAHGLGHQATAAVRFAPATAWFALPWRTAYRIAGRVAARFTSRQPIALLVVVTALTFAIAIGQAAHRHAWASAAVLISLVVFSIVTPLVDAALSRAAERAADRWAAQQGLGEALAHALTALTHGEELANRRRHTLLDTHPDLRTRIEALRGDRPLQPDVRVRAAPA